MDKNTRWLYTKEKLHSMNNDILEFIASKKQFFVQGDLDIIYRRQHGDKPAHVIMFSDFFSNASEDGFCTNAMYAELKEELINSIDIYNTRANIVVDVLEKTPSDNQTRELILIGFQRYVKAYRQKLRSECLFQLIFMIISFVLGVILAWVNVKLSATCSEVTSFILEVISFGLIWQIIGWFAFEYPVAQRDINRHKQLLRLEYSFKQWE